MAQGSQGVKKLTGQLDSRLILTSRGKPKAALVSIEDYEHLRREFASADLASWRAWLAQADGLADEILARRGGAAVSGRSFASDT